jgi:methionyl-tRNA formyltransferase
VKELDAGGVLLARETPIDPGENAGELAARLADWLGELPGGERLFVRLARVARGHSDRWGPGRGSRDLAALPRSRGRKERA